jgi:hypothetical protein
MARKRNAGKGSIFQRAGGRRARQIDLGGKNGWHQKSIFAFAIGAP